MAKILPGSKKEIMTTLLFQGDRQHKGTKVCVSHGHGDVSLVMQLVFKRRTPKATCED